MEEELKYTWVALLFLLSYMSALYFGQTSGRESCKIKRYPMRLQLIINYCWWKQKQKFTSIHSCWKKFSPLWTILVFRESIHCILRIECGEIWPWEICSITVTFTALCAHGCLVLNYAAGDVIWPQRRQEASYHGPIFSKPKEKKEKKIHKVKWIYGSTCLCRQVRFRSVHTPEERRHVVFHFPLCLRACARENYMCLRCWSV